MDFLLVLLALLPVALYIVWIKIIAPNKNSCCPKCKQKLTYPKDISIFAGEQKWKDTTSNNRRVRMFYRLVCFDVKCSHCQHEYHFIKDILVNRSDSGRSQNTEEELQVIKENISKQFTKDVFPDGINDIKIDFVG